MLVVHKKHAHRGEDFARAAMVSFAELDQKRQSALAVVDPRQMHGDCILLLGKAQKTLGNFDESIAQFDKAAKRDDSFVVQEAQYSLGRVLILKYITEHNDKESDADMQDIIFGLGFLDKFTGRSDSTGIITVGWDAFLLLAVGLWLLGRRNYDMVRTYLKATACNRDTICYHCDVAAFGKFPRCGHCKMVQYCCVEHQRRHWKVDSLGHKFACPLLRKWRAVEDGAMQMQEFDDYLEEFFGSILQ